MRRLRFYFSFSLFLLLLAACVPEEENSAENISENIIVTPENSAPVFVCGNQVFTANSGGGKELIWFLDGLMVGRGSEYLYEADDSELRWRKYHLLVVKETFFSFHNNRSWIIINKDNCTPSQSDPDPGPIPEPDSADCTTDNSCKVGTLTPVGSGYSELEEAQGITVISFPDTNFDLSLVSDESGVAPPSQEGYATARIDADGTLFSRFDDLTLVGSDQQCKVLNGGAHLVVLILDNAPSIFDSIGRSDVGDNDLIAHTTVIVNGDTTININYNNFKWNAYSDLVRHGGEDEAFQSSKSNIAPTPVEPIGYDPFAGSCFIHSTGSKH